MKIQACVTRLRRMAVAAIAGVLLCAAPAWANDENVQLIGWLETVWSTAVEGGETGPHFAVSDETGATTRLIIPQGLLKAHGGARGLFKAKVRVIGTRANGAAAPVTASSIQVLGAGGSGGAAAMGAPVTGSQKYATLMCRFGDNTKYTPERLRFFQGLYAPGKPFPSLEDYWKEVSYDNVDMTGSDVAGWYNLPQPLSYYYDAGTETVYLNRMMDDCAAEADADFFFPDFDGINLVFNGDFGCCAWGGNALLTIDGQSLTYAATWMPEWAWRSHKTPAHEMGHSFGLPHSSGPYGNVYDSVWDVMSSGGMPNAMDDTYGRLGNHTITYHKDILGWIPAGQKYTAYDGTSQTIFLERTALPTDGGTAFLMAEIPLADGTFYTAEARRYAGYEGFFTYSNNIPEEGVLLHHVDPNRTEDAHVVDPDGVAPVTYAALGVGESWTDAANGITVDVISDGGTGFNVSITHGTVTPKADLAMTAVSGPANADQGAAVTVSTTVNNSGDADAGTFQVGVYLSADAAIDGTDTFLGSRSVAALAQGASDSADTGVTIPVATAPGQYWLGAIADDTGVVDESNEGNNALAGNSITVTSPGGTAPPTEQWVARYDANGANDEGVDVGVVNGVVFVGGHTTDVNDWNIDVVAYGSTDGTQLYAGSFDSGEYDLSAAVAGDAAGNGYAAGHSFEADYTSNTTTLKFNTAGRKKVGTHYGNSGVNDRGRDVAVDASGNIYMTGYTGSDYITVKYNDRGQQQWAAVYDSGVSDSAGHIAVDGSGNVYVTGNAGGNVVTVKYDAGGAQQWTQSVAGGSAAGMILGGDGNVYVAATVGGDLVAQAISPAGAELWQTASVSAATDLAVGLAEDGTNVYVAGTAQNANSDYALAAFAIGTGIEAWAVGYDGGGTDTAAGVAADADGVYVTGSSNADYLTVGYDASGAEQWTLAYDNGGADYAAAITVDGAGGIYVTGKSGGAGNDFATVKYAR